MSKYALALASSLLFATAATAQDTSTQTAPGTATNPETTTPPSTTQDSNTQNTNEPTAPGSATNPGTTAPSSGTQDSNTQNTNEQTAPGSATNPVTTAPSSAGEKNSVSGTEGMTTGTTGGYLSQMTSGHMLLSQVMSKSVYDQGGESIGEVNDVVVDQTGRILGVVIGVGGFLGIGEKDVAVPFERLTMQVSDGQPRLMAQLAREELEQAPGFRRDVTVAPRATDSGTGTGTTGTGTGNTAN